MSYVVINFVWLNFIIIKKKLEFDTLQLNRKRSKVGTFFGFLFLLLIVAIFVGLFIRFEWEKPALMLDMATDSIGSDQGIKGTISDGKSGLRKLKAVLVKDGKEMILFEKDYPKAAFWLNSDVHSDNFEIKISLKDLNIPDGTATLRVTAWDCSWNGWFHGNKAEIEKNVMIDTKPPMVSVLNTQIYVNQGGTGFVVYKTSEPCLKSGVNVGGRFFKGFKADVGGSSEIYYCFFALSHEPVPLGDVRVEAFDQAGNSGKSSFKVNYKKKNFKLDTIPLSDRFFESTLSAFQVEGNTMLDKFLSVNRDLRAKNAEHIFSKGLQSEGTMLWKGIFLRLPDSAPRAGFADERIYTYNGNNVDRQFHLGADLASLAKAKVPAANSGKVVLAENVGIYGNTVMIDHGFGVMSLYSHLSQIDVQVGQNVEKGQIVGLTGQTGLAAGDHLHFSMVVQDMFVNPIEWWDPHWIQDNVKLKMDEARSLVK